MRLLRIGLSATQNPIDTIARLLVGSAAESATAPTVTVIDIGHQRARDLQIELTDSPLEAVMSAEVWQQVYDRLARLIDSHRTTLVFVNTRRMAGRVARALSERLGVDAVIRGGRFVSGFSGEQCALPEAVGLLRETRRQAPREQWISLSGADPLNLIGILTPGPKLPALTDNRLIYRDGVPFATLSAGKVDFLTTLDSADRWDAEKRLVRSAARGLLSQLS